MNNPNDLISRMSVIEQIKRMPYWHTPDGYCAFTYDDIEAAINNSPAVDAAPVAHGRWEYERGDPALVPCSVCKFLMRRYNTTHYCPNCGAKMEEPNG